MGGAILVYLYDCTSRAIIREREREREREERVFVINMEKSMYLYAFHLEWNQCQLIEAIKRSPAEFPFIMSFRYVQQVL